MTCADLARAALDAAPVWLILWCVLAPFVASGLTAAWYIHKHSRALERIQKSFDWGNR